jgi:microcystin-dependent protein
VSRASFAALFTEIGTTYGVGDGSTTFTLPDMRGRVPGGRIRSGAPEPAAHTGGELHHQDLTPWVVMQESPNG